VKRGKALQKKTSLRFKVMASPHPPPAARRSLRGARVAAASLPSNRVLCNSIDSITRAADRCRRCLLLSLGHL